MRQILNDYSFYSHFKRTVCIIFSRGLSKKIITIDTAQTDNKEGENSQGRPEEDGNCLRTAAACRCRECCRGLYPSFQI